MWISFRYQKQPKQISGIGNQQQKQIIHKKNFLLKGTTPKYTVYKKEHQSKHII